MGIEIGGNINVTSTEGETPLHIAAYEGSIETVKILLEHGASINEGDDLGFTPLYFAIQQEKTDTVQYLLDHGADIYHPTDMDDYPEDVAKATKNKEILRMIMIKKIEKYIKNELPKWKFRFWHTAHQKKQAAHQLISALKGDIPPDSVESNSALKTGELAFHLSTIQQWKLFPYDKKTLKQNIKFKQ